MKLRILKNDEPIYRIDLEDDMFVEIIDGEDVPAANRITIQKEPLSHALIIEQRDRPMYMNPLYERVLRLAFMQRSNVPIKGGGAVMTCQRCKSERVAHVSAKCSDMFNMDIGEKKYEGYVPEDVIFGEGCYGDYVRFKICLDCGQMQGHWPNPTMKIEMGAEDDEG